MGILRALLALAVVDFHSSRAYGNSPLFMLPNGVIAVQCFYMISGFYMSLVLSEKYGDRLFEFYRARLLRLLPIYWIVLVATLVGLVMQASPWLHQVREFIGSHPWLAIWMALSNATLFGQDINLFVTVDRHPLADFNAVNQAWTIGVELLFYAIVPWLVKLRTRWLLLIILVSLTARFTTYYSWSRVDPWHYRFFPFELAFFVAGMLAQRAYEVLRQYDGFALKIASGAIMLGTLSLLLSYEFWLPAPDILFLGPLNLERRTFLVVLVSLPFLFLLTKNSKIDNLIGDFSYPLYMCHVFVLQFVVTNRQPYSGVVAIGASIAMAGILIMAVKPIERWRSIR